MTKVSAIPNPTIVWGWVYATVGGRKKVSDEYRVRVSRSCVGNGFNWLVSWGIVIPYPTVQGYCYDNSVVTAKTRIRP